MSLSDARDRQSRKNAQRIQREQDAPQKKKGAIVTGYGDRGYTVKEGQAEYPDCQSITNGAIGTGQHVIRKGQLIDQQRKPKGKPSPPAVNPSAIAPFKYLYRTQKIIAGTTFYTYWVGGHSRTPIKLFTTTTLLTSMRLSNLPGNSFILDTRLSDRLQSWRGTRKQWEISGNPEALIAQPVGYGFFAGGILNPLISNTEVADETAVTTQSRTAKLISVYKGKVVIGQSTEFTATVASRTDGSGYWSQSYNAETFALPNQKMLRVRGTGGGQSTVTTSMRSGDKITRNTLAMSPNAEHVLFFERQTFGNDSADESGIEDGSQFEDRFLLQKKNQIITSPLLARASHGQVVLTPSGASINWMVDFFAGGEGSVEGHQYGVSVYDYILDYDFDFLANAKLVNLFYYKDTWNSPPGSFTWEAKQIFVSNAGVVYTYYPKGQNFSKTKPTVFEVSKLNDLDSAAKIYKRFCYPPHTPSAVIMSEPSYYT